MAQVAITINGKEYSLACDDGQEERIRAAGALLSAGVDELSTQIGRINDLNLVIMAGVMLADDLIQEQSAREAAAAPDLEELAVALEYLADKLEAVASRLAPA